MLTGLIYPTQGNARVLGYTPFDRKRDFLLKIGLVMGNKAGLNWDLTARQSFSLFQKMYSIDTEIYERRVTEYCDVLKVSHKLDTQVRRLSLGERMKLELIGAILHDPEILFLDEPTIGLDIESKHALRSFLKKIHKEKSITLILTSHDMDDIESVCDRVIVINHGKLLYDDSLDKLESGYSKDRYIRIQTTEAVEQKLVESFGTVLEHNRDYTNCLLSVAQEDLSKVLAAISKKTKLADITIEATPLEK